jgi:pyruvate kinase
MSLLRIIATLGPASRDSFPLLREAGADAFRLNSSHMSVDEIYALASAVRSRFADLPIVIDLQGAKMRLGNFPPFPVAVDTHLSFTLSGTQDTLPLPHPELFASIHTGDTLSFDDDRIRFRVVSSSPESVEAVALSEGVLQPRKGANVLEHPVNASDLSATDSEIVERTASLGDVGYAYSFMKDGTESAWIRRRAPGCLVIGKIERHEATASAAEIADAVDELWICRGDLGAQLGFARMAQWISSYDPKDARCPVLMAGQVLEHLTASAEPTRSEVCHLWDLAKRGYAGFVLSDETAIGREPAGAVKILAGFLSSFQAF